IVEMLLLAGDFKVAATRKVAVDGFVSDYLLDAIDGGQRCRVHSLRELAPIPGDEFVPPQLHARQHHSAIAGTGAPANGFGFEDRHFGAALGQSARSGKASKTSADHGDLDAVGKGTRFCFWEIRGG